MDESLFGLLPHVPKPHHQASVGHTFFRRFDCPEQQVGIGYVDKGETRVWKRRLRFALDHSGYERILVFQRKLHGLCGIESCGAGTQGESVGEVCLVELVGDTRAGTGHPAADEHIDLGTVFVEEVSRAIAQLHKCGAEVGKGNAFACAAYVGKVVERLPVVTNGLTRRRVMAAIGSVFGFENGAQFFVPQGRRLEVERKGIGAYAVAEVGSNAVFNIYAIDVFVQCDQSGVGQGIRAAAGKGGGYRAVVQ